MKRSFGEVKQREGRVSARRAPDHSLPCMSLCQRASWDCNFTVTLAASALKRRLSASQHDCSRCRKLLPSSAFSSKNGVRYSQCEVCRKSQKERNAKYNPKNNAKNNAKNSAKNNAEKSARKHQERLAAAAAHGSLRSPLRTSSDIEAIATIILLSTFFAALESTPASILVFATAQVAIGSAINDALKLILQEGLNSFGARNYYLPKVVTATCTPIGQSIVRAASPILRVLFISDRVDHVSSGKFGVEAAIMRQLFEVNDPYGGRLLNKNPDAKNCNARAGYFCIVAALVFPDGIEAFGWHVQRKNTVVPHVVPVPSLVLPELPPSHVVASPLDFWLHGDGVSNEAMIRSANEAYSR